MSLSRVPSLGGAALLLAALAPAQQSDPVQRGLDLARQRPREAPLLVDAESMNARSPLRASATPQPVRPASRFDLGANATADPASPPLLSASPPPFLDDRPVLAVDGATITTGMLNELVVYYRSFKKGSDALLVQDAVEALVPGLLVRAKYAEHLPAMQQRIRKALSALRGGADFATVVGDYSDDDEAPTADGRYTFGREVAVQPFDRLAHSTPVGTVTEPFLTRYGYHVLQVVSYQRGDEARDDRSEVRHVLAMYPFEQDDPRREIESLIAGCRIQVLEAGFHNAVPPEWRDRIVP